MYFQTLSPLWLIKFTSLEIIDSDQTTNYEDDVFLALEFIGRPFGWVVCVQKNQRRH